MCVSRRWLFRLALLALVLSVAAVFLINLLELQIPLFHDEDEWVYEHIEIPEIDSPMPSKHEPVFLPPENDTEVPVIVWWTPFTPFQRVVRECPGGECIFTQSRTEVNNTKAAFIYYGTELNWHDLPLPRQPNQLWALLHEESPKNNWILAHENGLRLFNFTSTCSRYSNYPLPTQFLHTLQKLTQPVRVPTDQKSKGDLGLVVYIQSDCNPPSDRDSYVEELMKYVRVDSYGRCLHNRDLPEHLLDSLTFDKEDLLNIVAKYKFAIAFENAICHDYITEKFWRPLYAGSVPIVKGSPTIRDWAPNSEHSIVVADDFLSPKALAEFLHFLDENDSEYEKYLEFKKSGVTNTRLLKHMEEREWVVDYEEPGINFIDGFECYVCGEMHKRLKLGEQAPVMVANGDHYHCPIPEPSLKLVEGETVQQRMEKLGANAKTELEYWRYVARCSEKKAAVVAGVVGRRGTQEEVTQALREACHGVQFSEPT